MKKLKWAVFSVIFSAGLFLAFTSPASPENSEMGKVFNSRVSADFIIVFNPGGWGDTTMEQADDLTPIIEGIKNTIDERGYESLVVPYYRAERGILAKIAVSKDFFSYFQKQSSELAVKIGEFLKINNGKKIIMVGLSNGASFVDETMKKISGFEDSVFAIEIGAPFWQREFDSGNILRLDNENGDSLSAGQVNVLLPTLLKAPIKWFLSNISGAKITFSRAFSFPQHAYFWDSPEVEDKIISFIDDKLAKSKF
jgi:hypothetical protein